MMDDYSCITARQTAAFMLRWQPEFEGAMVVIAPLVIVVGYWLI